MTETRELITTELSPTFERQLGGAALKLAAKIKKHDTAASSAQAGADRLASERSYAYSGAANARSRQRKAAITRDAESWRLYKQHGVLASEPVDMSQVELVTRDVSDEILDSTGRPLGEAAARGVAWAKEYAKKIDDEAPVVESLASEHSNAHPKTVSAIARLRNAELGLDAVRLQSLQHYRANEAAYHQQALEEAAAAGGYENVEVAQQMQMSQHGSVPVSQQTEHRSA